MAPTVQDNSKMLDSHLLTDYEISDESYSTPSKLSKSVDGTISDVISTSEMKITISQLNCKLTSTEHELENTILENNDLHKKINKLTAENKILRSLCNSSSIIESSPSTSTKIKRHSLMFENTSFTPTKPEKQGTMESLYLQRLQVRIADLQQQLKNAEQEIEILRKQIENITQNVVNSISPEKKPKPTANYPYYEIQQRSDRIKIHILGGQQCVGLAAAITQSRRKTLHDKYEKYEVIAETKSYAPTHEILKNYRSINLKSEDKLVICVGENDQNIQLVLTQLQDVLNTFHHNTVIVLNVINNIMVNVTNLNNSIQYLCKNYKKCHFIDFKYYNVANICKLINYVIDCSDYEEKYLKPVEIRKMILRKNPSSRLEKKSDEPKKGTIPFYFNGPGTAIQRSCSPEPIKEIKKGTIPYYFRTKHSKQFFRS